MTINLDVGTALFAIGFMAWGALWWWARGGRFGAWCRHGKTKDQVPGLWWLVQSPFDALRYGFEPGTQFTRAVTMLMLVAPLALIDWRLLALWPTVWLAVAMLGWGSYMDMGDEDRADNERTAIILRRIGFLRDGTTLYDLVGMTLTGVIRGALIGGVLWALGYSGELMLALGLMGPAYWLAWRLKKRLPRDYTEFAEMASGALVALLMMGAIHAI